MKSLIKALLAKTPYRILRDKGRNRFDAADTALKHLRDRGYRPKVVIDGGAHAGLYALMVREIYPEAAIHMIEAQPACLPNLEQVAATNGFHLHPCAIGSPEDAASGFVTFAATDVASTGAHVAAHGEVGDGTVQVPVRTLDTLLSGRLSADDRAFLKMDLQGYELAALKGATEILPLIEVIQTEVSFFAQAYEPSIVELMTFLDRAGFDLFDIAALSERTRDNRLRQGDFIFVRRGAPLSVDTSWA